MKTVHACTCTWSCTLKSSSKPFSADLKLHRTCSCDPALKQVGINLCGAVQFEGAMKWWQSQGNGIGTIVSEVGSIIAAGRGLQ